jgi:hypothetical protein
MSNVHREKTNYDYTMEELADESLYTIKNRCFLCEIRIENNWNYFTHYGNCCMVCSIRVSKIASKYKSDKEKQREALLELEERRRLVKSGKLKKQV